MKTHRMACRTPLHCDCPETMPRRIVAYRIMLGKDIIATVQLDACANQHVLAASLAKSICQTLDVAGNRDVYAATEYSDGLISYPDIPHSVI